MNFDIPSRGLDPSIGSNAAQTKDKHKALDDKAKIFSQLKSTELRRKIGRGIQIGATAVAVVAAAGGIVALHFTPVGWAILGVAALAIGVTAIAACVSKARGGSLWNEVLKPQLKGLGIGIASVVALVVLGAIAAGGGGIGDGMSAGGATGFELGMMTGYSPGNVDISLPIGQQQQNLANRRLQEDPQFAEGAEESIKQNASGPKITKSGREYGSNSAELYDEAVQFVAKGTKPNLERAARRLEKIIELNPNDNVRKLELAELCMMIAKPETAKRAVQLLEELRSNDPKSILIAGKEVKALRKAGLYQEAIDLGTAYQNAGLSKSDNAWFDIQINRARQLML